MNKDRKALDKVYENADQSNHGGIMNCLEYILRDANEAHLDMVALHLKIAIRELQEYQRSALKKRKQN